jgi:hypothetical protein
MSDNTDAAKKNKRQTEPPKIEILREKYFGYSGALS